MVHSLKKPKDFPKKEKKGEEWARIRLELEEELSEIQYCELRFPCCKGTFGLAFAHSKKRIDIALEEPERTRELKEVVRACSPCHHYIEYPEDEQLENGESGREYMFRMVTEAIKDRQNGYNW